VPAASMLASSMLSEKVALTLVLRATPVPVGVLAVTVGAVVSTGVVSTVQVWVAGLASVFPAASFALTSKVCEPSERSLNVLGASQAAKVAPSRLHSKVESFSVEENSKVAEALFTLPEGPSLMVVSGAVVSTVKVRVAADESSLPAASVAFTSKVLEPAMKVNVSPEEQALNLAHLCRHTRGDQILLLGTYRDVEVGPDHPLRKAVRELDREPLPRGRSH
jgi:hypothetical protein